MIKKQIKIGMILGFLLALCLSINTNNSVYAKVAITVSPMNQTMTVVPGKKEVGSFIIANPADNEEDLNYELYVSPFYYEDKSQVSYNAREDYSRIVDWIKLDKTSGTIAPGKKEEVSFSIDAPKDALAGGQYAAIIVRSASEPSQALIENNYEIAHLIYAEVAGETKRGGEVNEVNVPGFMLSGDITGSALVHNAGSIHAYSKQTLKVFPLFGGEEFFTNEENPKESFVMPGATQFSSVNWDDTPFIGIFRVEYDVEFEGVTTTVSKVVIICPLWLIFVILLAITALVIWIAAGKRSHKSNAEEKQLA